MNKKRLFSCMLLLLFAFGLFSLTQKNAEASTKKYVCVTKLTSKKVYYYNLWFEGEIPHTTGKKHSLKLKKTKYYLFKNNDFDADSVPSRCSKKKMKRKISQCKRNRERGFYCMIKIKKKKCVKIEEVYWP